MEVYHNLYFYKIHVHFIEKAKVRDYEAVLAPPRSALTAPFVAAVSSLIMFANALKFAFPASAVKDESVKTQTRAFV